MHAAVQPVPLLWASMPVRHSHQHVVLHCPEYAELRVQLRERLVIVVGEEKVVNWEALSAQQSQILDTSQSVMLLERC